MSNTQNEFAFEDVQQTSDRDELPKQPNCLTEGDKNVAAAKLRKNRRPVPTGTKPAAVLHRGSIPPTTLFLSDREVAQRYSVSRPTIWRWAKDVDDFPRPVKIAKGTTRWRVNDLEEYERTCGSRSVDPSLQTGAVK